MQGIMDFIMGGNEINVLDVGVFLRAFVIICLFDSMYMAVISILRMVIKP
ncbi:hypothetical protein [Anaeromicropila populeti]|uniref:Uncharacterized protein n=1 Tax=Anaeromicropila populeti TaxID=37658 RepID=A0A1I6L149_9FIRM|nr:hypothetical protein [Anaeromicropila populeti]SFR97175.1 hypothetical protein SAMN05661086_02976 [Anaeromicropila populeti]